MNKHMRVEWDGQLHTALVTRRSAATGETHSRRLAITPGHLEAWERGSMVQHAFPDLTPDEREFLISGTTPEEWEKLS